MNHSWGMVKEFSRFRRNRETFFVCKRCGLKITATNDPNSTIRDAILDLENQGIPATCDGRLVQAVMNE